MSMFRTLGRRSQPIGTSDILLSGIIYVTFNQKASSPKLVEITYNAAEDKTAMYIYKNKDKKRPEAAIDLKEATVFVNYDTENGIGIITRENRIYCLELEKERDDLERFVAQWRSVLTVAKNPNNIFSVITVSGEDRGCVILVTLSEINFDVNFKYMSGRRKNTEVKLNNLIKVQKYGGHEVNVETRDGDSYHFISKRSDFLLRKLQDKVIFDPIPNSEVLPTKSHHNNAELYDSKAGYTPTFQPNREVHHIPDDYLTMDHLQNTPHNTPPSRLPPRYPAVPDPLPPRRDTAVPDPLPPRRDVPIIPQYTCPYQPSRNQAPEEDYLTMDYTETSQSHVPVPPRRDMPPPSQDYTPMDQLCRQDPLIADYLTMDTSADLSADHFDDYLVSDRVNGGLDEEEDDDDLYFDPSLMPPPRPPRVDTNNMPNYSPVSQPPRVTPTQPPRVTPTQPPRVTPSCLPIISEVFGDDIHMSHGEVKEIRARVNRQRSVKHKNISQPRANSLSCCPTVSHGGAGTAPSEVNINVTKQRRSSEQNERSKALSTLLAENKPVIPERSEGDKLKPRPNKQQKQRRPKSLVSTKSTSVINTSIEDSLVVGIDEIKANLKSPTLPPRSRYNQPQPRNRYNTTDSAQPQPHRQTLQPQQQPRRS